MDRKRKLVFAAACIGMFLFGIAIISLGSILPVVISKYRIDELAAGTLTSLLPFGILTGSFIFGPVVDRYGYKHLLIICALIMMTALEGMAFSNNYFLLKLSIFLIGFGGGLMNGATNALMNDISNENRSANLSLLGVFFGIGALGMPALIGTFSKIYSEEIIISVCGFVILLPVIYFFLIEFPKPKQSQSFPFKESLSMLKEPMLVLMGIFLFFESGMEGIVNNWTTTYLQNFIHGEKKEALFALSYFVLSLTITRLFLGYLLRNTPPYLVQLISICTAAAGALVLMFSSTYELSVLGLVLLGIGFAAGFPVFLGYVGELYKILSGTAFSFVMVIALIGNILINYAMGLIAYHFGIKYFSSLLLICLLFMMITFYFTMKKLNSRIKI